MCLTPCCPGALRANSRPDASIPPDCSPVRVTTGFGCSPVWDYDLMALLRSTKPDGPGGRELPLQEYLDRQSEWNFVILYEDGGSEGGFVAVAVRVNDWIIWLSEIGV